MSRARISALALAAAISAGAISTSAASADPPAPVVGWAAYSPGSKSLEAIVDWTADQSPVTFTCGVDAGKMTPCATPLTLDEPAGQHVLHIVATNSGGKSSQPKDVTIDFVNTKLDGGPADGSVTSSRTATFTASSDYPGARFQCSLGYGDAFKDCGPKITYDDLADGEHTLFVRAYAGDTYDRFWQTRTWTVEPSAVPAPTPTPTPMPSPVSSAPLTAPAPTPVAAAAPTTAPAKLSLRLSYRARVGKHATKLTRLSAVVTPAATPVTVSIKTPRHGAHATTFKRLLGRPLTPGTKITVKAGKLTETLTIRAGHAPKLR
jgi:hypothetical protein